MDDRSFGEALVERKLIDGRQLERYRKLEAERGVPLARLLLEEGVVARRDLVRLAAQVTRHRELPDALMELGFVTEEQLRQIYQSRGGDRRGVGRFLVERGLLTEEQLARALARLHGVPFNDLTEARPDPALLSRLGQEFLERHRFVPLGETAEELSVAVADPANVLLLEELAAMTGKRVRVECASPSAIGLFLSHRFESKVRLREITREMGADLAETARAVTSVERISLDDLRGESSPVIRMVNSIIYNAIERRASDIHFEAYEREVKVKYRIDGVLYEVLGDVDRRFMDLIVTRVKILAELDIAEHRVPQDGRFVLRVDERYVDFRVSVLPTIHGETAVIRILDKLALALDAAALGLDEAQMARFLECIRRPYGMVLVAGPTGSGKTTTLYSALKAIQRKEEKIVTIEDPVEYQLDDIVQIPVNEKKGLTFARGLRSIVRQDPDVIMVGEIRDLETAQIAINAALTGHLLLSTIHSNNVIDALSRLINLGVEEHQFAASFNLLMAQRLVRKVCNGCRREEPARHPGFEGRMVQRGAGCRLCNGSGYFGRTAIFELLELDDEMREMILEKKNPIHIKRRARERGMRFLRDAALRKVDLGITTPEEIDRVTFVERH